MQAAEILKLISGALQDFEPDCEQRWSWDGQDGRICLLDYLNEAVRAVVMQRPDLMSVTEVIRLEPGMRQSLPSPEKHGARHKATMLIELVRNMGSGDCPGPAIISVNPDLLMAWACCCHESEVVENFAYDRIANPKWYLVYPAVPQNKAVYVEATFSHAPCLLQSPEQQICLPDAYGPALMHHCLGQIFSGDGEMSQLEKASWHVQNYNGLMGIKTAIDKWWPKGKSSDAPGGAA